MSRILENDCLSIRRSLHSSQTRTVYGWGMLQRMETSPNELLGSRVATVSSDPSFPMPTSSCVKNYNFYYLTTLRSLNHESYRATKDDKFNQYPKHFSQIEIDNFYVIHCKDFFNTKIKSQSHYQYPNTKNCVRIQDKQLRYY